MQPRLMIQTSVSRSWTIGKSMTLPDPCSMEHVASQGGRGRGVRFMKKKGPAAPSGYRFMTMARSRRWGSSAGATAT